MMRVGLLGWPVGHSQSPKMHKAAFSVAGLTGHYEAIAVSEDNLESTLTQCRLAGFRGLNVTVPHKLSAMQLCSQLDESATATGAVNTIIFATDGSMTGANTDVAGFLHTLTDEGQWEPADKTTLVVGSGGAARAAVYALKSAGASSVWVTNRTKAPAEQMASAMSVRSIAMDKDALADIEPSLVVNATSCGLGCEVGSSDWRNATSFFSELPWGRWTEPLCFDLIYSPRVTPFLTLADASGHQTLGGLGMLVRQGALSFQMWTGVPTGRVTAAMRQAVS
jgi:shikimate dehydrogenase